MILNVWSSGVANICLAFFLFTFILSCTFPFSLFETWICCITSPMTASTWQIYLFCACRLVYAAGMIVALSYVCPQQFTNVEARNIKHVENCYNQLYYFVPWTGNESYKVFGGPSILLVCVIMRVSWCKWDTPGTESAFIEKCVVSQAALAVVFKTLCNMSFIDWPQAQEDVLFWVSVHRYLLCKEGVIFCNCL
jgi:hypothetical protein